MKLPSLTLALTAFNEELGLGATVDKALSFLPTAAERWELLIINDGSTDGTAEIADGLARRHRQVKAIHRETNGGMGAGIKTAIQAAEMEWFCTIAADGQVDPHFLEALKAPAMQAPAVFTTYSTREDGLDRKVLTQGLRYLILLTTGTWKVPTGNYFIKTAILKTLPLRSDTFVVNYEIYFEVRRRPIPLVWTQIPCVPREAGASKVRNVRKILSVMEEVLLYRLLRSKVVDEQGWPSGQT